MIYGVGHRDPGKLHHLAARIITGLAGILTIQHLTHAVMHTWRQMPLKAAVCHVMGHRVVIVPDIYQQHIAISAVLPVFALHHELDLLARPVGTFAGLAGRVLPDETPCHCWINSIVVERALVYPIPKAIRNRCAGLGIGDSNFDCWPCLVCTCRELLLEFQDLVHPKQVKPSNACLAAHAFGALALGIIQGIEPDYYFFFLH